MKCDELKVYRVKGNTLGDFPDVYIKSEADKVISGLKARIAQLEDDNALLRKNNAELRFKNEGLLYALADEETGAAMVTRWRKYSEEKPEDEECVLVVIEGKVEKVRYRKFDGSFHNTLFSLLNHSVKWWLPLPKSPED